MKYVPKYIGRQIRGGYPVDIQVTAVLWPFANSHFWFRLRSALLNISDGSLNNFPDCFVCVMQCVGEKGTTWPKNDLHRTKYIAHQSKTKGGSDTKRLGQIIRSMDRKLVAIQKPGVRGNMFVDRKNNPFFNLLAIRDSATRFIFIKYGDSGTESWSI